MTEDYVEAFVRESEENIVELNNALLALEDDPGDKEAMDRIFRNAHTVKGNFSAMGYADTSELGHAIEDLLDEIRGGRLDVTPGVMDLVFEGVDLIEAALDDIEEDGEVSADPSPVIEEIRGVLDGEAATASGAEREHVSDEETTATEALDVVEPHDVPGDEEPIVHVRVELGESQMPGVDGMLLLETVTESFEVVALDPSREDIEAGDYGDGLDLIVAGEGPEPVREALTELAAVEAIEAEDVTAAVSSSEPEGGGEERDSTDEASAGGGANGAGETATVDDIKSIRIDVGQLDTLYGHVEQLVTNRIKLRRSLEAENLTAADEALDELDKVSSSLQSTVMDMRLVPFKKVVNTFPRMVRDLARQQDKEIDFTMEGTDVELDRTILDEISDPLMHILRNAVDHGIESPEVREDHGKHREGKVRLSAERRRDHVEIVVADDGGGLDVDAIREKAVEKGVHTAAEAESMDDGDVYDLIFHPGLSTNDEVTEVSGRGVGMDAVASTVDRLDGSVSVDSTPEEGTTVTLRLPVSVAIVRVLFVDVADQVYGIPIKTIDEITQDSGSRSIDGREALEHDDAIYPVIDLRDALLGPAADRNGDGMLLRIRKQERPVALRCNGVDRLEEVVIKPLDGELSEVDGMGGTAVIGDGDVVPIIDVGSL